MGEVLERHGIDPQRPIVTQISRFDRLKDPLGVIQAYEKVKRNLDCQLVLAGGEATDDPEGKEVLEEVKHAASDDPDIHVVLLPPTADLEINALQRGSTIVVQKSLKEGFGLTVTEALWKGKPVVASAVGGIPLQIKPNTTGMLVPSVEGAAYAIKYLLTSPEFAKRLGENGREHVRQHSAVGTKASVATIQQILKEKKPVGFFSKEKGGRQFHYLVPLRFAWRETSPVLEVVASISFPEQLLVRKRNEIVFGGVLMIILAGPIIVER